MPDFFANSFMDDSMGGFLGDQNTLDAQLAELSGLLGGDANAPQFLQEMLMLQMQAEAWRMQWSVAMQENEELRAKLYDTRNSLEAAGGGGASGEHWRELCISIAKSAEDEKAQILEALGKMREELDGKQRSVDEQTVSMAEMRKAFEAQLAALHQQMKDQRLEARRELRQMAERHEMEVRAAESRARHER